MQHIPVLKKEVLSFLRESDCNIADLTAGLGGHSKLFLQQQQRQEQGKKIKLFLVDRDEEALKGCRKDLLSISKKKDNGFFFETDFFHNDFYSQTNCWKKEKKKFNFIFADLGVSSLQLDNAKRGFSFLKEGELDMRMDKKQSFSAKEVLLNYDEKKLIQIFKNYGEERYSRSLAKKIVQRRKEQPFLTATDLSSFIAKHIPKKTKIHPATRIFQAIRIEVNQELKQLESMLSIVLDLLADKGRLVVISFHSLEDRIVKQKFKSWAEPPSKTPFPLPAIKEKALVKLLCKKPIIPSKTEIQVNPRSRSAKMRVIEKI